MDEVRWLKDELFRVEGARRRAMAEAENLQNNVEDLVEENKILRSKVRILYLDR